MSDPGGIGAALRAELHGCFTVEQIVELTLDVMAWNRQKVLVAQETDRPAAEHGLSALSFDAAGHHQAGGAL